MKATSPSVSMFKRPLPHYQHQKYSPVSNYTIKNVTLHISVKQPASTEGDWSNLLLHIPAGGTVKLKWDKERPRLEGKSAWFGRSLMKKVTTSLCVSCARKSLHITTRPEPMERWRTAFSWGKGLLTVQIVLGKIMKIMWHCFFYQKRKCYFILI